MPFNLMGHYPTGLWVFTWHYHSTFLQRSLQWALSEQYKIIGYKGLKESSSKISPLVIHCCVHVRRTRGVRSPLFSFSWTISEANKMQTKNTICSVLKHQISGYVWCLTAGTIGSHWKVRFQLIMLMVNSLQNNCRHVLFFLHS